MVIPRATDCKYWLEEVGLAEIRETIYKRPTITWPKDKQLKEIGKFQLLNDTEGLEGLSVGLFTKGLQAPLYMGESLEWRGRTERQKTGEASALHRRRI